MNRKNWPICMASSSIPTAFVKPTLLIRSRPLARAFLSAAPSRARWIFPSRFFPPAAPALSVVNFLTTGEASCPGNGSIRRKKMSRKKRRGWVFLCAIAGPISEGWSMCLRWWNMPRPYPMWSMPRSSCFPVRRIRPSRSQRPSKKRG